MNDNYETIPYTSVIKQLFYGVIATTEICSICGYNNIKTPFEPTLDFSKNLTSEWNMCSKNNKHLQTTVIHTRPNILVILFQRFKQQKSGRISKNNKEINLVSELKIPGFSGNLIGYIEHQ